MSGEILYQNSAAMALYGNRGIFFSKQIYEPATSILVKMKGNKTRSSLEKEASSAIRSQKTAANDDSLGLDHLSSLIMAFQSTGGEPISHNTAVDSILISNDDDDDMLCHASTSCLERVQSAAVDESSLNFLQLLLLGCDENDKIKIEEVMTSQASTVRAEILSPKLRSWMNLAAGEHCFHDITIISSYEPNTLHKTYIVTQMDVTSAELANRAIKQANAELAEERERIHALLQRQYELIDILRTETTNYDDGDDFFTEKINFLRRTIAKDATESVDPACAEEIRLGEILGQGNVSDLLALILA